LEMGGKLALLDQLATGAALEVALAVHFVQSEG